MNDILLKAALAYRDICKHQYIFTLSNGECIHIIFKPQNFVHLAGLRKFSDVRVFDPMYTATNIYRRILKHDISVADVQCSVHYDPDTRARIENLCRLGELLHTSQIVWNFDQRKAYIHSRIKSNVLFFKDDGFNFYLLLGAAQDGATYYPETFFLRYDDAYIKGQTIVQIEKREQRTP